MRYEIEIEWVSERTGIMGERRQEGRLCQGEKRVNMRWRLSGWVRGM